MCPLGLHRSLVLLLFHVKSLLFQVHFFFLFISAFLFLSSFDCLYCRHCCCISNNFSCQSAFCYITSSSTESMLPMFFCLDVLLLLLDVGPKIILDLGVSTMLGVLLGESSFTSTYSSSSLSIEDFIAFWTVH